MTRKEVDDAIIKYIKKYFAHKTFTVSDFRNAAPDEVNKPYAQWLDNLPSVKSNNCRGLWPLTYWRDRVRRALGRLVGQNKLTVMNHFVSNYTYRDHVRGREITRTTRRYSSTYQLTSTN